MPPFGTVQAIIFLPCCFFYLWAKFYLRICMIYRGGPHDLRESGPQDPLSSYAPVRYTEIYGRTRSCLR